ncbi:glycosyltransferase family 4 protein [candidate division WOR-3 bacterium]|nr:glycosyltransferase family 4 protein [candidate division WOR-3 bacterium]
MEKVISILHYSALPVIGGVEFIIDKHSKLMKEDGFKVNIIAGEGNPDYLVPELNASHYHAIQQEIVKRGTSPVRFHEEVQRLKEKLLSAVSNSDLLIAHNIFTMHFNLVATAALIEIAKEIKTIAWVHDIAYIDTTYHLPNPKKLPLKLITEDHPGIRWVAISQYRKEKLSEFLGISKEKVTVVPDGMDVYKMLPPEMEKAAKKLKIFSYYPVVIFPSRLTRRKNFEMTIDITAELEGNPLLLLSAPPDPHNPSFSSYKNELMAHAKKKGLTLIFLSEHCQIKQIYPFYFLGDILLISSRMEGFSLPALEGALFRLPIALSNIPPLKEIGKHFTSHIFFDLDESPKRIGKRIMRLLENSSAVQNRRMVLREYNWEEVYKKYIKPLL